MSIGDLFCNMIKISCIISLIFLAKINIKKKKKKELTKYPIYYWDFFLKHFKGLRRFQTATIISIFF
jgi:hypothetical protein